ncbi:MAG: hypothetical protein GY851_02440 [bacterium]|nr:hypothetical protein [bacterium]
MSFLNNLGLGSLTGVFGQFLYTLLLWGLNLVDDYVYDLGGFLPGFDD